MRHIVTVTHEVEAESWDLAVEALLREDNPVKFATRVHVESEHPEGMTSLEVPICNIYPIADKVRGECDEALDQQLAIGTRRGGKGPPRLEPIGTLALDGYRLISVKHLRLLLAQKGGMVVTDDLKAMLKLVRIALQKAAWRGEGRGAMAVKAIDKLLGELK